MRRTFPASSREKAVLASSRRFLAKPCTSESALGSPVVVQSAGGVALTSTSIEHHGNRHYPTTALSRGLQSRLQDVQGKQDREAESRLCPINRLIDGNCTSRLARGLTDRA